MKLPPKSPFRAILAFSAGIAASLASSQVAPATSEAGSEEEDALQLDAFSVTSSRERGYGAKLAPTAVRLNAPLEDLPINVNVMSHDFLVEINESDTQNVLSWNASISGGRNSAVRGFGGNAFFVDGHQFTIWYPTAYIDRVELVKGPASMWVSRTSPGGTVNYIRNKAIRGVNQNQIKFGWGDVNGMPRYHATIDSNRTVSDKLAVRFIADYAEREDNTMPGGIHTASKHSGTRAGMLAISANYRFSDKTDLTAGFFRYESNIKSQDGRHTARGASISFPDGSQIPVPVLFPDDIDQFEDFGWGRNFPIQSHEMYIHLTHAFNDTLTGTFKANYHTRNMGHRDANGVSGFFPETMKDGSPNVNNEPAVRETWFADDFSQTIPDLISYFQWEPKLTDSRQIITGGLAWSKHHTERTNYRLTHPGTNQTYTRHWFFRLEDHPQTGPNRGEYTKTANFGDSRDVYFATANLNWYGRFIGDRLNLMAGVAFSSYDDENFSHRFDVTLPTQLGDPTTVTRVDNPDKILDGNSTNPMVGALWKMNENWSLFGQASTSLDLSTAVDGFGNAFDPVFSKGFEGGVKINALEDRIRGSIVYYNIKQDDTIVFDALANNIFYQATVDSGNPDESLRGASAQVGSVTGDGIEVDLQLNITENWFANISYANFFDRKITDDPNPANIGQTVNGHIPHTLAVYNKYRFTKGPLEGLQVGGGFIVRADQERRRGSFEYRDEGFKTIDLNAQYHIKHTEKVSSVIQVTLRNITEEKNFYTGWDAANGRKYALENPMIFWVDYKINF